jgi:hypothetical protein
MQLDLCTKKLVLAKRSLGAGTATITASLNT